MTAQTPEDNGRTLYISVPDDVYDQIVLLAASKQMPTEEYAARMLVDDVTEARFLSGAQEFISEHGPGFAARFGPHTAGDQAA